MAKFKTIKAVQFGCGPIGCSVVRYAAQRPDIQLIGAIDIDKNLVGRDLGEVAGLDKKLGFNISNNIDAVLSTKPDVVFHTTSSSLKVIAPQVIKCINAGSNIVSTCEELSYPFRKDAKTAADIEKAAKANKVTILATGINPGFLMDTWPLFITGVCQRVEKVKAIRFQDASTRRGPFQKKIGAGLIISEFNKLVLAGAIRHVGLAESVAAVADGLKWDLDNITESIEPVIAQKPVKTQFVDIKPGQATGVRQVGKGIRGGLELVTLEFMAAVGAAESYDAVYINGIPNLEVVIKGGVHGDIGTAAITVNAAHRVVEAPPGLLTMQDIPIIIARGV